MVADVVALAHLAGDQPRLARHVLADDEEGRRDVLLLEDVEDLRSPAPVGAIVEGQRHPAGVPAVALHDVGGRQLVIEHAGDQAVVGIDLDLAVAGLGRVLHP